MWTRRRLLEQSARAGLAAGLWPLGCAGLPAPRGVWVNDVHSRLNRTRVARVVRPGSPAELRSVVREAGAAGRALSIAAGRHAMGGQQFGTDTWLLDMNGLARVLQIDLHQGWVEAEAGIQWPELMRVLAAAQPGAAPGFGIRQKQTGADRLSLGGALAANAHGRGLAYAPFVEDVEAFTLVDSRGRLLRCSRSRNPELFALAIGGYGLFGVVSSIRLRLAPRRKLERVVDVVETRGLAERFEARIREGYLYGDFQYSTDAAGGGLLRQGVLSCYRPVPDDTPMPPARRLGREDWLELIRLAHTDRGGAFERYAEHYRATSGQIYWSDTHQLSTYIDDYHSLLAPALGARADGSEMISELYVPRHSLEAFLEDVREDFLEHRVDLIYGTVRLIERDRESFLAWARQPYACIVFNLHTQHDPESLRKTERDFRRLIDRAIGYAGCFFLTYHRWAQREQLLAGYPQLPELLRRKLELDPEERFQSDWYRHLRGLLADVL